MEHDHSRSPWVSVVVIVLIIVSNAPTAVDVARAWSMVAPDTMSMLSQPSISASELERNLEGHSGYHWSSYRTSSSRLERSMLKVAQGGWSVTD